MVGDLVQTGLSSWWAPALAFAAGAVSFASPCVFPLVPGYISFVTGERSTGLPKEESDRSRRSTVVPIALFILGFSVVLVLLGAFSGTFVRIFKGPTGQLVGGLFILLMGLLMLGFALGRGPIALYVERRPLLERARPGGWSAFPLGVAFATGWTPCLGPVLTGILAIAASQGALRGVVLLSAYSLGLGLPFLLVGLGVQRAMGAFGWVRRNYRWIAGVSGVLMIAMGLLLASGKLTRMLAPLTRFAPFGL